jgi:hypothetical protein
MVVIKIAEPTKLQIFIIWPFSEKKKMPPLVVGHQQLHFCNGSLNWISERQE